MNRTCSPLLLVAALTAFTFGAPARAADFSKADEVFAAKVSQGGMYEVELGRLAESKGVSQQVKDSAQTEVHDHMAVGHDLRKILEANGYEFPTDLNAHFKARLDKMKALPASQFDAAYIQDMQKIHHDDGAAFAEEAKSGTNADLKEFAANTYQIVQRHIGQLGKIKD